MVDPQRAPEQPPASTPLSKRQWRGLRALLRPTIVTPLFVAIAPLSLLITALWVSIHTTLGRDQGIFQYVAYALSRGERDYVDVRDVNGPFIHLVHRTFLALGGGDELRFHLLDRIVTTACFFLLGAALPSLSQKDEPRKPAVRLFWGAALAVAGSAQYLRFLAWDLAQRENFCGWLACIAAAGLFVALDPARTSRRRENFLLLALSGFAGVVSVFGKHTFAPFVALNVFTIAIVGLPTEAHPLRKVSPVAKRLRGLIIFAFGGILGLLAMLADLAYYGDIRAFFRIWFVDAPQMYVYIWPHTPRELYDLDWNTVPFRMAAGATVLGIFALAFRLLPLRALPVVFWSAIGVFGVILQKKGFPYHLHPATFGVSLLGVTLAFALADRSEWSKSLGVRRLAGALGAVLAAVGVYYLRFTLQGAPHVLFPWPATIGATAAQRGEPFDGTNIAVSRPWLDAFRGYDYYPREMRGAAAFLAAHTAPGDRVQTYGIDPYVLFFAKRLSATPYIYSYDLDADAAWHGALDTAPPGREEAAAAVVKGMEVAHWKDVHARLDTHPAAAWVLFDRAPLTSFEDALEDIENHDAVMAKTLRTDYWEAYAFGAVRVFLRRGARPFTTASEFPGNGVVRDGGPSTGAVAPSSPKAP